MAQTNQSLEDINKKLVPMLDKIQKSKLNIDRKQEKENNEILKIFLEALITKMKEQDPLFNELYQKIFFTGSYYEGLRVSNPSEFDMNLVLKFPIKSEDREIETGNNVNPPSFARFRLKIPYEKVMSKHPHPEKYQGMEKFFDGKNYLCPMKVRSWIQSVVDRANKSGFWSFSKVTVSRHGPAETMYVCIGKDEQIEIDLVPSLEFKTPEWPSGMEKLFPEGNCQQEQSWFLIPKPYRKISSHQEPKDVDVSRLWRLHFPEIENKIMYEKGCLKTIIKFLKLLRDKENWRGLASYYLKTVVLWEAKSKNKPEYWKQDRMGVILIEMLEKLDTFVQNQNIPYLFYPKFNLIREMNPAEAEKIHNRLQKIIKRIKTNPCEVCEFF